MVIIWFKYLFQWTVLKIQESEQLICCAGGYHVVSADVGLCLLAYMHIHTHTQSGKHKYICACAPRTHTPLAIFAVIQQTLHLASSSFLEPPKNNLIWGRKGMSHTEVKILKGEKLHKCLSKMFIKKGQRETISLNYHLWCWHSKAKSPGHPGSLEKPPPCCSRLLFRVPFFLVFPSGLMFHWPINVYCNYTDFPLLLCSPPSLYFLYCLHNTILHSKNK